MVAARRGPEAGRLWQRLRASRERQAGYDIHQFSGLHRNRIPDLLERPECEWSCVRARLAPRLWRAQAKSDCFAEIHGNPENSRSSRSNREFHLSLAEPMPYPLRRAALLTP